MTTLQSTPNRYIILTGYTEWDEVAYASYCRELGVATCDDTADQALDQLEDAIAVYLEGLVELGQLERIFAEKNIQIHAGPPPTDADTVTVSLPIGKTIRVYAQPVPAPVAALV